VAASAHAYVSNPIADDLFQRRLRHFQILQGLGPGKEGGGFPLAPQSLLMALPVRKPRPRA
jgi:hypothetical protein